MKKLILCNGFMFGCLFFTNKAQAQTEYTYIDSSGWDTGALPAHTPANQVIHNMKIKDPDGSVSIVTFLYDKDGKLIGTNAEIGRIDKALEAEEKKKGKPSKAQRPTKATPNNDK